MPTMERVWQEINALPHRYIFYTRKEIRYLPKVLGEDEHILAITSGMMSKRTWLAVCTNRRVLFIDRGMFFGVRQVQMNLDRLQAIDSNSGLLFGNIRIWDSSSSIGIGMVLRSSIAPFVRTVQDSMDRYKRLMVHDMASAVSNAHQPPAVTQPPSQANLVAELERLSNLKAAGHLSEDEYAKAKAKLLSS